jgi:diadenosine tetraphosphatase ApaH/serine/threonine PP2A family protein phosphatase
MQAILSDIHGNLEALTAVLADIQGHGIQRVYNLGDTVGYGPNPLECLDLALQMHIGLLGNFDRAIITFPDGFCISAERSILWTRAQLDATRDSPVGYLRAEYMAKLTGSYQEGEVLYVHGSARQPINEYVFPEDIYHSCGKLDKIGAAFSHLCFCGHTHIPGIFRERAAGSWEYIHAEECERGFPVRREKLICNVGAVGQPRDDDERACYALFDGERIWIRRVAYDFEATIRKIYAIPDLDNFLGDRLREGR